MAVFTQLSNSAMEVIRGAYGFGPFEALIGLVDGDHESSYLVATSKRNYFLTVFETQVNPATMDETFAVMDKLADVGLPCPRPCRTANGLSTFECDGRLIAIVEFRAGLSLTTLSPAQAQDLGRQLGRLHVALNPDVSLCGPLPEGTLHGALAPENVFFVGQEVSSIINYRLRHTGKLLAELALCLANWTAGPNATVNLNSARALLEGYQQARPLTDTENALLPGMFAIEVARSKLLAECTDAELAALVVRCGELHGTTDAR